MHHAPSGSVPSPTRLFRVAIISLLLLAAGCNLPTTPLVSTLRIDHVEVTSVTEGTVLEARGRFTAGTVLALCEQPLAELAFMTDAPDATWVEAGDAIEKKLYAYARGTVPIVPPGATCELRMLHDSELLERQEGEAIIELPVEPEAPGAIASVTVRDGDASVQLSFDAPFDGGRPIDGYEIQLVSTSEFVFISGSDAGPPLHLEGLENGVVYAAVLRAVNEAGAGPASAPLPLAPFGVPGPPTDLAATSTTSSIDVTFSAADPNGRLVEGYEYRLRSRAWVPLEVDPDDRTVTFDGLEEGTTYTVRIRAVNEAGVGPDGRISVTTEVTPGPKVTAVAAGAEHTVVLMDDGSLWAWGQNRHGQLGVSTTEICPNANNTNAFACSTRPIRLEGYTWSSIATGNYHTFAVDSEGIVRTWGYDQKEQIGNGSGRLDQFVPHAATGPGFADVGSGFRSTYAVTISGTAYAWGENQKGQLGIGSTATQTTPQALALPNVVAIDAGQEHGVSLLANGDIYTWGDNRFGQLGNGTKGNTKQTSPGKILSGSYQSISAGLHHTLVLDEAGDVWAWGWNLRGQLATGTQTDGVTPTKVFTGAKNVAIGAGSYASFVIDEHGTMRAVGQNDIGQLGTGSAGGINTTTPVEVLGGPYVAVAAGDVHVVALDAEGDVWTWGLAVSGRLGHGNDDTDLMVPTKVQFE